MRDPIVSKDEGELLINRDHGVTRCSHLVVPTTKANFPICKGLRAKKLAIGPPFWVHPIQRAHVVS